jgi:transcriptional regulator with XRE-family HTH domain
LTVDVPSQLTARELLAAELRHARALAGISGRVLARRAGISQSKVSRIESGLSLPSGPEVMSWAKAADAPEETAQRLARLTEAAFMESRLQVQGEIADLESQASLIRTFQPALVPGLLQTAEYARRVLTLFDPPYARADIPALVAARLDRQLSLYDEARGFEFLITEAALRWRPGPSAILRAQLDRIATLSTLGNVRIGIIPLEVEATVSMMHSFVILESPTATSAGSQQEPADGIVTVEVAHANLVVRDPKSLAAYRRRWALLAGLARYDAAAVAFLRDVSGSLPEDG